MHIPVLADRIVTLLKITTGECVVDCTAGLGGHTKLLAEAVGKTGKIIAIELDPRNVKTLKENIGDQLPQVTIANDSYKNIQTILENLGLIGKVDVIFFDLGISSPHVDDPARGFSFQSDGPLDMRFSPENPLTAHQIVNEYSENELRSIFGTYGEEPRSGRIAKKIVEQRQKRIIQSTVELSSIVQSVLPAREQAGPTLKRIFQALRIAVNHELDTVKEGLIHGFEVLRSGGRMGVITYHSLEDRLVKHFFKEKARSCICPSEIPLCVCTRQAAAQLLTKKPITPSSLESHQNKRSRSAQFRILQKN